MAMPQSPGLILDTHADIQELVEAGMPQAQAETVVRQHARLLELNLATKTDIAELRAELKTEITELNSTLKTDVAELKISLIKWLFAVHIGTATIILTILAALGLTK